MFIERCAPYNPKFLGAAASFRGARPETGGGHASVPVRQSPRRPGGQERQQREQQTAAEPGEQCQAAELLTVLAGDGEAHLFQQVVLFGVRRFEQADLTDRSQAGRGFGCRLAGLAIDAPPVAQLDAPHDRQGGQGHDIAPERVQTEEMDQGVQPERATDQGEAQIKRSHQGTVPLPDGFQAGVDHAGAIDRDRGADGGYQTEQAPDAVRGFQEHPADGEDSGRHVG